MLCFSDFFFLWRSNSIEDRDGGVSCCGSPLLSSCSSRQEQEHKDLQSKEIRGRREHYSHIICKINKCTYFDHVGSSSLLLSSSSSVPVMDCILSLSRLHPSRHHYCSPPNQNSTKTTGGEERRGRQQLPEPAISLSCLVLPATASSTVLPLSLISQINQSRNRVV